MKTVQKFLVLIGLMYFSTSCSEDERLTDISNIQNDTSTELNSTLELIKGYGDMPQTKSDAEDIVIDSYHMTTYSFSIPQNTRARSAVKDSTDINLYYVTFSKGENKGYAIATGDKRVNRVYAYTEAGSIEDTTHIYPLACIIRSIPNVLEQDVRNYYADATPRAGTYFTYGPLITTSWSQGSPYNMYTPTYNWADALENLHYDGRYAAGCTNVATAQVIAYYEKFTGTMFGNRNIDFENLKSTPTISEDDSRATIVGNFFREIISKNNSVYQDDGSTGASLDATYTYLKGWAIHVV